MSDIKSETTMKKLINFTHDEWNYIQNYKHANKLKTDTEAIKSFINNERKKTYDIIMRSMQRNSDILKELADR